MNSAWFKISVILIVFLAEGLSIYSEMRGAKIFSDPAQTFAKTFFRLLPIIIIAAIGLLVGYMLGLRAFANIWIVSVISITSILILEPILAFTIFRQLPTRGALFGLIFGVLGFISALFW